jgi:diphthine-ammonia ligase
MADSFHVIALISGGKDSFYSILHCVQNGHKVVALGNLYPPAPPTKSHPESLAKNEEAEKEGEQDLNSFMYQTVGHTVIPLYEEALGIPLYRQQIIGSAIQTGTSYSHSAVPAAGTLACEAESRDGNEDETESLIPLLKGIIAEHPDANALCTGAILSTYQRTRVESVALRLGLTPLSYLWQYPSLPPETQTSLLRDMQAVGLDARIVKVASGGLDEGFLWENVASEAGIRRVERSMKRFGVDGDGGVLGEGGEFETLVVDGPRSLVRGRIVIREEDRRVVVEGGGSAWLRILDAKVVMKTPEAATNVCRVPDVLEQRFKDVLHSLTSNGNTVEIPNSISQPPLSKSFVNLELADIEPWDLSLATSRDNTLNWTVTGRRTDASHTISDEASEAILGVRRLLDRLTLPPSSIVSTMIILRSMPDFASVNSVPTLTTLNVSLPVLTTH